MMISKMKTMKWALAVTALTASTSAFAGESDGTLLVSATVLENCTIVATPMAFGALTDVGSANVDTTSTLTLACTPGADFFVSMNDGANASGGARRMVGASSGEFLPYEIYTDNTHTTVWGSTEGTDTVAGTAPAGVATLTAFGRIASGTASPSADVYSDTVTVTVNF